MDPIQIPRDQSSQIMGVLNRVRESRQAETTDSAASDAAVIDDNNIIDSAAPSAPTISDDANDDNVDAVDNTPAQADASSDNNDAGIDDIPTMSDEEREYLAELSGSPASEDDPLDGGVVTDDPTQKKLSEEYESLTQKYKTLETELQNPLVQAVVEFAKSGREDLVEFAREIGAIDSAPSSVEDMYRQDAIKHGVEEDDLDAVVEEQMEKFNSMTTLERKKEEANLRSVYKSQSGEKLKTFTEKMMNQRVAEEARMNEVYQKANVELDSQLQKMENKHWKGLMITSEMAKTIRDAIPAVAPLIAQLNEHNQVTGFDVKEGIEFSIYKLYGKELLKSTFNLGRTAAAEDFFKDRVRPTGTAGASAQPAVSQPTRVDEIKRKAAEVARQNSGKRNIFQLQRNSN